MCGMAEDTSLPERPTWQKWAPLLLILAIAAGAAWYFTKARQRQPQADPQARALHQQLLQIGVALKQYATANDNALPERLPPQADASGVTYRAVTGAGERVRYVAFGDRIVAWTKPDGAGRRAVLLNSLDEVEFVPDANFDRVAQRRTDSGALNRVRIVDAAEPEGGGGDEEEEEEPTTEPTTNPSTTAPTTARSGED